MSPICPFAANLDKMRLFLFLFLFAGAATGRQCPDCGSTAVPFPLSTASGCGDPSYRVRCDPAGSALFFDSVNGSSYPITAISPATQRLVIRPAPFLSGGASCVASDLPFQGIQLNSTLPFNVSSSNTIMFFNCTPRLLLSPLNCSSDSLCHVYANATADAAACRSLPICCTFVAGGSSTSYSIRASETGCSAYRSFVSLNAAAPVAQWATSAGVELQWASPREPLCATQADCQGGASATCSPDPTSGGGIRRCFCVAGLRWDPISGACVNSAFFSATTTNLS